MRGNQRRRRRLKVPVLLIPQPKRSPPNKNKLRKKTNLLYNLRYQRKAVLLNQSRKIKIKINWSTLANKIK